MDGPGLCCKIHVQNLLVIFLITGNKVLEVQILEPQRPALYIVIVLSYSLIGSCSSSIAKAAQNNCRTLGSQDLYFLKLFVCSL